MAPGCGAVADATSGQSGLASGACVDVTQVQANAPLGVHTGWVMADSGCVVTDSNENNNVTSASYTLLPSQGPDLVVDPFTVTVAGHDGDLHHHGLQQGDRTRSLGDHGRPLAQPGVGTVEAEFP